MYITQSRLLKEQFWTQGKINDLLGEPDRYEHNPRNDRRPIKYYSVARANRAKDSYYAKLIKNGPTKRKKQEPNFDGQPFAIVGTLQF